MDLSKPKKRVISINYSIIALLTYLIDCILYGATYQDSIIVVSLVVLVGFMYCCKEFFRLKEKVISENNFRDAVNKDMTDIKQKLSTINLATKANPFGRK